MEVDPPSTNASVKGQAPATQKSWKKRGLRALNHPHLQPQDHLDVLQTVTGGKTTDWDLWDTVVEEALVYGFLCFLPSLQLELCLATDNEPVYLPPMCALIGMTCGVQW